MVLVAKNFSVEQMDPFIQQRNGWDCTVAATAMFVGISYEEAEGWVKSEVGQYRKKGVSLDSVKRLLRKRGIETCFGYGRAKLRKSNSAAIVTANPPPPLLQNTTHAMYWSGTQLFDPQRGRHGKPYYRLLPRHPIAWLVRKRHMSRKVSKQKHTGP